MFPCSTPKVPVGPRLSSANRLAVNVSSWAHVLASSNSGTASKQWLVVDFNRFEHLHLDSSESRHVRREVLKESTLIK